MIHVNTNYGISKYAYCFWLYANIYFFWFISLEHHRFIGSSILLQRNFTDAFNIFINMNINKKSNCVYKYITMNELCRSGLLMAVRSPRPCVHFFSLTYLHLIYPWKCDGFQPSEFSCVFFVITLHKTEVERKETLHLHIH